MEEELLVSGRMNNLIDPQLNIWHWQIPLYLFLGGMAAGILCIAALYFIRGRGKMITELQSALRHFWLLFCWS